ncbi:hypothetical protein Misp01_54840 [Microtetraspora sp. NBRC 13810]|uniref:hypothetical protein n=1 Tax=Microtetraspora sp. NBRC 13810 TaxID=3030990 RepID=UPI0024A31398|nr:hypothetical protein [Microtetraspora sp. NBRC 13810]GLW10356.1 hypothetical protein Misp01_54840 [Microtetraspora sp. NBRC 13810]
MVPVFAVLLAAGVGTTVALGGFDETPYRPGRLGEGSILEQGQFRTRILGARLVVTPPHGRPAVPERILEIDFEVTNLGARTQRVGSPPGPGPARPAKPSAAGATFAASVLRITPPLAVTYAPQGLVLGDGAESAQLHPGITGRVVLRYELAAEPPARLVLAMGGHEYAAGHGWRPAARPGRTPETLAEVTLPVRREAA